MKYMRQIVDLDTGSKAWLDLGDYRPLTEVAKELGVGPRRFRAALVHMEILQREYDERSKVHRHRLTSGAVESGFGIRHDNKGLNHDPDGSPFDVLSPMGVEFVRQHLPAALAAVTGLPEPARRALAALQEASQKRRSVMMTPEMRVYWLADYFPHLDASHVAQGLGISPALVHRYRGRRIGQIREATKEAALASSWRPLTETMRAAAEAALCMGDLLEGVES